MDSNTDQLDRLESKLDKLIENQEHMRLNNGRFQGIVYGFLLVTLVLLYY